MNVLIEFFDEEPIENLITCTHFHMDKVICFGYKPIMTLEGRGKLKRSHKALCGDHEMEFVEVPYGDLNEIVDIMDGVLIMTVNPGFAGQKLAESTLDKIAEVRALAEQAGKKDLLIEVDGNVSFENAVRMSRKGADIFVAGTSSVFRKDMTMDAAIEKLKESVR